MTDEYLERIDARFARIDERFDEVDARFARIDERFNEVDARFAQIDERFDEVDARFARIDERFDEVDARFARIDGRLDRIDERLDRVEVTLGELGRHMRLLHEDVLGRLKDSSERNAVTKPELDEAIAAEHEETDRRLVPLELVVRDHSQQIEWLRGRG